MYQRSVWAVRTHRRYAKNIATLLLFIISFSTNNDYMCASTWGQMPAFPAVIRTQRRVSHQRCGDLWLRSGGLGRALQARALAPLSLDVALLFYPAWIGRLHYFPASGFSHGGSFTAGDGGDNSPLNRAAVGHVPVSRRTKSHAHLHISWRPASLRPRGLCDIATAQAPGFTV